MSAQTAIQNRRNSARVTDGRTNQARSQKKQKTQLTGRQPQTQHQKRLPHHPAPKAQRSPQTRRSDSPGSRTQNRSQGKDKRQAYLTRSRTGGNPGVAAPARGGAATTEVTEKSVRPRGSNSLCRLTLFTPRPPVSPPRPQAVRREKGPVT